MPYTIFTPPAITPAMILRPTLEGSQRLVENPEQVAIPTGCQAVHYPTGYNRFSDDPAARSILLRDPDGKATGMEIFAAFPGIRLLKDAAIRVEGGKRLRNLATPYGPEEREGWESQKQQARAWLADNTTSVPTITAMATTRGIDVETMVNKIMQNVALYETAYGQIVGEQQRLLDLVYAATDYDSMMAINWP